MLGVLSGRTEVRSASRAVCNGAARKLGERPLRKCRVELNGCGYRVTLVLKLVSE